MKSQKTPIKNTDQFENDQDFLVIKGAREHNLKNVSIAIPKNKLVVFTGLSGSGKSSLAFDTIFAEGQRRYVESLSSYARQFLGQMEKPKYDSIRGLAPAISIDQKSTSKNPRSTVGTITEVYDYLRVLYARIGTQYCHICGKKVGRGDSQSMVNQILEQFAEQKILLLAPLVENRKGEFREMITDLTTKGYQRVRIDGTVVDLQDVQTLAKHKKHTIEVVVDRLHVKADKDFQRRLADSVETSLKLGKGNLICHVLGGKDLKMSEQLTCCGFAFPQLDPPLFSFNSPIGMCPKCNGIGTILAMDVDKVIPDQNRSLADGAIAPWTGFFSGSEEASETWTGRILQAFKKQFKIDLDTPWKNLKKDQRDIVLYGSKGKKFKVSWQSRRGSGEYESEFEGILNSLMRRYRQTQSEMMRAYYTKYMSTKPCHDCAGKRLKPEVLSVRVGSKSISDFAALNIGEAKSYLESLNLNSSEKIIADELLKEIGNRLGFLINVGLSYLTLDRKGPTLSGGEAQRIRLASQIGSELTGVLYILDEPSIGLHQRDNRRLLDTLKKLRDLGNSVIVVEHDHETILEADWAIDFGPGAGKNGGEIIAADLPSKLGNYERSITGEYLSNRRRIETPIRLLNTARTKGLFLSIIGASENNLKNINVKIPLSRFVCITGVSGAGKSTLVNQILSPYLSKAINKTDAEVGNVKKIEGHEAIDKVVNIDQKPIGRTPRSNPATYSKLFDLIRDLFALLPESRLRGFEKGRFSFNVKGGRCEACQGDGYRTVEMHFLPDVFVPCEVCKGKRFNQQTLEVLYKGYSIADVLDMSVAEAMQIFKAHSAIMRILQTFDEVGLSYIALGQAATTLSGGEAQRVKLARELAKKSTGRTFYILDEPTTGLHFEDVKNLLQVLHKLVDAGNSVVVIEHNLDVIKTADWIIDLGPEGGEKGGYVLAEGTPVQVANNEKSITGQFLLNALQPEKSLPSKKNNSSKISYKSKTFNKTQGKVSETGNSITDPLN